MTLWDQSIGWLLYWSSEEATLDNLILLTVAKQKPSGRKTDDQGDKESSAPEFILYVHGWLGNFPKMTVGNWRAHLQNSGIRWQICSSHFLFRFAIGKKNKEKKENHISHPPCFWVRFSLTIYLKFWVTESQSRLIFLENTREKINAIEFRISLHVSFVSS